jgi:hypothetical protein
VRARRKEQVYSQLLSELTPFTDMTVVPSIIDLQRRFPGLGKVWATSVHEKLRYDLKKRVAMTPLPMSNVGIIAKPGQS